MNGLVFYLIHSPNIEGLIFPYEIEDENYYTIGSFYIDASDRLSMKYTIHAVHDDDIVETSLLRVSDNSNFFTNEVDEIGDFIFFAEKLPHEMSYVGNTEQHKELILTHRLRIFNPTAAEHAAEEYNFYFVGFSNLING